MAWKILRKDQAGVFIEIQFLDTAASCGQTLIMFILFGLDPDEIIIPAIRYFKNKWYVNIFFHNIHRFVMHNFKSRKVIF